MNPKKNAYYYNSRGVSKHYLNKFDAMMKDYDQAIKLNPNFDWPFYNRAGTKDDLKKYDEAIKDYDQAIKLNNEVADYFNNRGEVKVN